MSQAVDPHASSPRTAGRSKLLAVLLAGQFMANVDTAIANLAAPSIGTGFGASEGEVALVVSGYIVAFAALLIPGARLGAAHGHRRVFLRGLAGFVVASLVCGLAPGIGPLIVARFAQGAAAAFMVPQVLSSIQLHFTGEQRVRALGYYTVALSSGAVAGQVLGGLLISADLFGATWRPVFLVNVPIGVALLAVARRVVPADDVRPPRAVDLRGAAALSVAVLLVIMPLTLGREHAWPAWTWLCLAASVPAFLGFVLTERRVGARAGRPLIAPAALRHGAVRYGLLAHGLTSSTYFALLFVLALHLQQGLGASAAHSGLAMVLWVAAFGLAGPLLARLPARHRPLAPMGGCLLLAAGYLAVWVHQLAGGDGPLLAALLGIGGLGLGVSANSLIHTMSSALSTEYASDLSGMITTNAQLCGALGVAVASTAYLALGGGSAAFAAVVAGFAVLALLAALAARHAARTGPGPTLAAGASARGTPRAVRSPVDPAQRSPR